MRGFQCCDQSVLVCLVVSANDCEFFNVKIHSCPGAVRSRLRADPLAFLAGDLEKKTYLNSSKAVKIPVELRIISSVCFCDRFMQRDYEPGFRF